MPTLFFKFGLRFYFVSFDCSEPCHIHVSDDAKKICKFWLRENNVIFADNSGFTKTELRKINSTIKINYSTIETKFNEYCKGFKK